jgi:hypothetical protein
MSIFCYTFAAAYTLRVVYTNICDSVWSGPTVSDSAEADYVSRDQGTWCIVQYFNLRFF